jgi:dephospho-CoA kinase
MVVIVGLTGGIASGKSAVTAMLRELGVEVIDADVIAREVVEPGEPALEDLVARFGAQILTSEGRLDRAALGQVVFADVQARQELGQIMHPRIGQRMWQRAEQAGEAGHRWVVYDAALLVENQLHLLLDSLIVVAASAPTQLERVMARDGLDEEAARARIASQLPLEQKVAVADYVIDNEGSLEQTRAQVQAVYAQIDAAISERGSAQIKER